MEKQTKNIITRESIEKDLLFGNTASIKHTVVCLAAVILAYGVLSLFVSAFSYKAAIFTCVVAGISICVFLIMLIRLLMERKRLKNGDVEIVIRHLLYKEEKMVRSGRSHRMQEMLHFEGFDEVWANHTEYQLASMDDEFYIAHYKGSKKAEMVFQRKLYEYKE